MIYSLEVKKLKVKNGKNPLFDTCLIANGLDSNAIGPTFAPAQPIILPTGPTGDPGSTGPQGIQGEPGVTGSTGPTGQSHE
ncbi:exosporium leader peptide-containing protein, partial [Bacillus wiedmannii]|uniref:exosporium leader peptide-containing protein n=1 Tax=Bacillus wiedmannii TaxID=1890302 RepID=UPI000BEB55B1